MGNSHNAEFKTRKQAIKEFLQGTSTQKDIYVKHNKTRSWFRYWLQQYQKSGLEGLKSKSPGWKTGKTRKYSSKILDELVNIRERLEKDSQEYYYGAESIVQELINLGYSKDEIPSVPYIKKVLSQKGCIEQTKQKDYVELKGYPENFLKSLSLVSQMDFIGYKRIHNSNYPIHFLALAYRDLKYGHIWRIKAEKSTIIMRLLFEFWKYNPLPNVVQMDNDWAFLGSGSAKGTLSQMIRFLLALGITPLFIPESSPWRNGSVEGLISVFNRKFWKKHDFKSLNHIDKELNIYNKKTRQYKTGKHKLNFLQYDTISKQDSFSKKLINSYKFKDSDVIYFIRLGRLYNECSAVKVLNYKIAIPEEFLNYHILIKLKILSETAFLYQEIDNKIQEIKKSKIKLKI